MPLDQFQSLVKFLRNYDQRSLIALIAINIFLLLFFTLLGQMLHVREAFHLTLPQTYIPLLLPNAFYTFWFIIVRNRLQKAKNGRIGLYICLQCEDRKQRHLVNYDLIGEMRAIIRAERLDEVLEVIELPVFFYNNFFNKKWLKKKTKKFNGGFFVLGKIKQRPNGDGLKHFFTKIESMIVLRPEFDDNDDNEEQKAFEEEFNQIFKIGELTFPENFPKGFEITGQLLHVTAVYIVGRAAFISGRMEQMELGLSIHEKILLPAGIHIPALNSFNDFIEKKKNTERFKIAKTAYYSYDLEKASKYAARLLETDKNNPHIYILLGILNFHSNKIDDAIKATKNAKRISREQVPVAIFNLAFLHIWKKDYIQAMKLINKIKKNRLSQEQEIVNELIEFCDVWKLTTINSDMHFWLGVLYFYKVKNFESALKSIEEFLTIPSDTPIYREALEIRKAMLDPAARAA